MSCCFCLFRTWLKSTSVYCWKSKTQSTTEVPRTCTRFSLHSKRGTQLSFKCSFYISNPVFTHPKTAFSLRFPTSLLLCFSLHYTKNDPSYLFPSVVTSSLSLICVICMRLIFSRLLIYGKYCSHVETAIASLDDICKNREDVRMKLEVKSFF